MEKTKWGIDYTFDCTGDTEVMRSALEVCSGLNMKEVRALQRLDSLVRSRSLCACNMCGCSEPQCAHRGWGQSCVIGVAAAGKTIQTRPFQVRCRLTLCISCLLTSW